MTDNVAITNRALGDMGARTTVASLAEQSNEAIQASLVITQLRDQILRMAPWNCARTYANLLMITATPGTPENTTIPVQFTIWQKGIPPPPWAYEYQYPVDCIRPIFIVPTFATGFASGVPITTAVTGGSPSFWLGPPQKYQVGVDQFFPATAAAVVAGGSGYAVGDFITLAIGPVTSAPIGAPAVLQVATLSGSAVATVNIISIIPTETVGGSYFLPQTSTQAQGSTSGSGTGATFSLTFGSAQVDQRVIYTNQEFATLCYVKQITNPDVMDPEFQEAWVKALSAKLVFAISGDKGLANLKIQEANQMIAAARTADANEGLTINDVTPDWIRTRGLYYPTWETTPNIGYDWGPLLTMY